MSIGNIILLVAFVIGIVLVVDGGFMAPSRNKYQTVGDGATYMVTSGFAYFFLNFCLPR